MNGMREDGDPIPDPSIVAYVGSAFIRDLTFLAELAR